MQSTTPPPPSISGDALATAAAALRPSRSGTGAARARAGRVLVALLGVLVAAGVGWTIPARAQDAVLTPGPQRLVSGLSSVTLGQLAVARDGSGGLVYSASSAGVSHVYLARLLNGSLQAPVQLDGAALAGAGEPVISADNGGELLVAFTSAGNLYVAETASSDAPLSQPRLIATGASHPSIAMNLYGVGYLAYTVADGSGDDVDVQYFDGANWAPASPLAMNANPGDVAGTGSGAPSVWAASDGVAIVSWGEAGHVYSRRIWGTRTSVEVEQDDVASLAGQPELSAGDPQVASGGDSTYPDIVFSETFGDPGASQTRAMLTRLVAEDTRPATPVDGLVAGDAENAAEPRLAMGEMGRGLITAVTGAAASAPTAPFGLATTVLGTNGTNAATTSISLGDSADPAAVPAVFGSLTSALAWDQATDAGDSQVLVSYAGDGVDFAAPVALSTPGDGAVDPAAGLALAGDNRGDGIAVWVQGQPGALAVESGQLYTPPGMPGLAPRTLATRDSQPTLSWTPAAEDWGPVSYSVDFNGTVLPATRATTLALPGPLVDGSYPWSVTATNAAGESTSSRSGTLIVDSFAPQLRLRLSGSPRVGARQQLRVVADDLPNPTEPGASASGVRAESVDWGDGGPVVSGARLSSLSHVYTRAGLYRLTVTVSDAAANTTQLTRLVRVLP